MARIAKERLLTSASSRIKRSDCLSQGLTATALSGLRGWKTKAPSGMAARRRPFVPDQILSISPIGSIFILVAG
jgi:hypothetical protein